MKVRDLLEYKRPEKFSEKDIDKTVKYAFGDKGFWQGFKDFITAEWINVIDGNTKNGFRQLKKLGLTNDQINEFRHQLHSVMGGMFKQKGYDTKDVKHSKNDPKGTWGSAVRKNSTNFHGWGRPIGSDFTKAEWENVQKQVLSNLKKKFSEK